MNSEWMRTSAPAVTDVYTDIHGLQNLKVEKDNELALKKVAEQFESIFVNMLLKNMRAANQVFSEGNMFDSQESQFYRDMYDHQLSLNLAKGSGFGIADAMYRQLSRSYGENQTHSERAVELDPARIAATVSLELEPDTRDEIQANAQPLLEQPLPDVFTEPSFNQIDPAPPLLNSSTFNVSEISSESGRTSIADTPEDFIEKVLSAAESAAQKLGIEKELLIAQSALETGWGQKVFSQADGQSTFNLFNIKADHRWSGESVAKKTVEFLGGTFSTVAAQFRSYQSIQDSFDDFTQFIQGNERYQTALDNLGEGLDFIKNIHRAGYATDPDYVSKIASVYDRVKSYLDKSQSSAFEQGTGVGGRNDE